MEFRWRSDSSRFFSPRDTKLYVKYKVGFGPSMTQGQEQQIALDSAITDSPGGFVPGAICGTVDASLATVALQQASFKRLGVLKAHTDKRDKSFTVVLDNPDDAFKVVDTAADPAVAATHGAAVWRRARFAQPTV